MVSFHIKNMQLIAEFLFDLLQNFYQSGQNQIQLFRSHIQFLVFLCLGRGLGRNMAQEPGIAPM